MKNISSLVKNYDQRLKYSLGNTYKWLLIPETRGEKSEDWEECHLSDEEDLVSKAANAAKRNDLIIEKWDPQLMEEVIRKYFWKDSNANEVKIDILWECIGKYLYFPKLAKESVLNDSIREGINRHLFAISNGFEDGKYLNLQFNCKEINPTVDYLVEWNTAKQQQPSVQEQDAEQSDLNSLISPKEETHESQDNVRPTGFFMNVELDKTRPLRRLEII